MAYRKPSKADGSGTMEKKMSQNAILKAAELRGQGRLQEAVDHIESSLPTIDLDHAVLAYREAFLAARDLGKVDLAREYAAKIAETDPELPSIKGWL
jgi:tetratricopeptide (TPR) repeat protein